MSRGLARWALAVALVMTVPGSGLAQGHPDAALAHARELLRKVILIDGHNDLPWALRERGVPSEAFDESNRNWGVPGDDIAALRSGEVGGQIWSVFIPGDLKDGHFARMQLEQIDIARRLIAAHPEDLALCLTADDIEKARASGRIASLLGMEGGHSLENSLGALRSYYDLGVRSMTLTHNVTLDWADAAMDAPKRQGLTPFGKEVVREMNRLGMLVDLSHVSPRVMGDALDVSEAPVIFSHSSTRALTEHPRNVPDEILKRLPGNGGVILITFVPPFVSTEVAAWWAPLQQKFASTTTREEVEKLKREREAEAGPEPRATLSQVADHIEHARRVAGVEHIGIGGDYPAEAGAPEGLEDVSKYPDLFAELIRRGWSDSDLAKLAGGNLLRALRRVEEVSKSLRKERPASSATPGMLDPGASR
jgi:membrane dipeptidase